MKAPVVQVATASAIRHLVTAHYQLSEGLTCEADVHLRTAVVIMQQFADMDKLNEEQKEFVKESIRLMMGSSS